MSTSTLTSEDTGERQLPRLYDAPGANGPADDEHWPIASWPCVRCSEMHTQLTACADGVWPTPAARRRARVDEPIGGRP